jgi:hypothetical protein
MTYTCPVWEFAAEIHLLKLQGLQNKALRTIGNLPRCTLVRDMHVTFQSPYDYIYITNLFHNNENKNERNIGQGETPHRKYKRLKLGGGHLYERSSV